MVQKRFDPVLQLGHGRSQLAGQSVEQVQPLGDEHVSAVAGDRLDAPDARADRFFAHEAE